MSQTLACTPLQSGQHRLEPWLPTALRRRESAVVELDRTSDSVRQTRCCALGVGSDLGLPEYLKRQLAKAGDELPIVVPTVRRPALKLGSRGVPPRPTVGARTRHQPRNFWLRNRAFTLTGQRIVTGWPLWTFSRAEDCRCNSVIREVRTSPVSTPAMSIHLGLGVRS
jgi:hypothetical protein